MQTRLLVLLGVLVVALCLAPAPALADTITFDLTVPNTALVGFTSPYASVLVNRTSTTVATITFTGLTSGAFTYFFGSAQAADVNVNATTFTVGSLGCTPAPTLTCTASNGGANQADSFGNFNLTIDLFDGFNSRASSITFTLTNTSGTWASASNVLIANAGGSTAAAHIFATSATCTGACVTGFAGNGAIVPEPGTLVLFGSGLLGIAAVIRRRFSA